MPIRARFEQKLNELRDEILKMGSLVDEEMKLALSALETFDQDLARQVYQADKVVNEARFAIEEQCFALIVTQQPAARDLRAIIAVMNMIVDLERMGDQAKGIAKVIRHTNIPPAKGPPVELRQMGDIVSLMLRQGMAAYATKNVEMAKGVIGQDDEVDRLFAQLFTKIMQMIADTKKPDKVEANYELLRAAQELERFGDLATNVAERVIYISTGNLYEENVDPDDILDQYLDR